VCVLLESRSQKLVSTPLPLLCCPLHLPSMRLLPGHQGLVPFFVIMLTSARFHPSLWFILRRHSVEWQGDGLNWNEFGRKRSWLTRSTIPAFAWMDRRKSRQPHSRYPKSRPRFEPSTSQCESKAFLLGPLRPEKDSSLTLLQPADVDSGNLCRES
jgi:hypothetical protein